MLAYMHENQFWGRLNFWGGRQEGHLNCMPAGMLHIAPDIGHAVCPVENTWLPIYVYENVVFDIVVDMEIFHFDVRV